MMPGVRLKTPKTRSRNFTSEHVAELRQVWGGRCMKCLATEQLEFAHLKPTGLCGRGRGLNHRVLDILRNPHDYVLLCRKCHRRHDASYWLDRLRASSAAAAVA